MRLKHRSIWITALVAALAAATALALVPGAQATKGKDQKVTDPSSDTLLYGGATSVALDKGAAGALTSLGISVEPVGPAKAKKNGEIRLPITFGVVDSTTLAGQIRHVGGLAFTKGDTTVYLTRYFIDIDDAPSLSGLVGAGALGTTRADLFDLDLSGLRVGTARPGQISLSGVKLTLTQGAADALNGAFGAGATPFTAGLLIGEATVRAHVATAP